MLNPSTEELEIRPKKISSHVRKCDEKYHCRDENRYQLVLEMLDRFFKFNSHASQGVGAGRSG